MHWIIEARQLQLNPKSRPLLLAVAVLFGSASATFAQADMNRAVDQYSCKDVLRESGANRDVAIAFLHGYLLGKAGTTNFNLNALRAQSDQFIEACLDKSGATAVEVMSSVKK